ncbi:MULTISPECIES: DUF6884 domain-containing protein [Bacillus]|uniref:DUF6884 domain-containing protein n=8 Tax=Bacteria TaxID=2 RepID=A0AB36VGQ7_BACTU|nr:MULTISPECIES: DUF6884 domain-containing protein [Bacillus]AEA16490.1 hypothetical protein CT43_CH2816 [Bacillus thuringiensis serovar chinensis CT-43]AFV18625.1 uncharacterized protein YfjM [Bacillus thuringiensis Bt407]AGG01578.1 hypothetical protein H175_ch2865 [Bacillus thuringiensis serovar thuringiensis str. IS5056]AHA72277.1 hypothetical protein YBT1518_15565 [Bacillus thuringiensis YBT-1518]ALC52634.1 hypothetical protein ACN91_13925 [Bacillus cereus]
MKRLCIIPCGKKKIWDKHSNYGPMEAKDVYISPFGKACQAYASMFFENWVILSAKHGFLRPNDIVLKNYDLAFDSKSDEVISIEKLQKQMVDKSLLQFDEIVLLAGKKHKKVVTKLYPEEMITYPLEGCKGIGYMLQRLKEAVKEEAEI